MQRNYNETEMFCEDYYNLRDFLVKLDSHNYHFGRWDWMVSNGHMNRQNLAKIGLWEEDGQVVACATYDTDIGDAFLLTLPGREHLREEMLLYAQDALQKDGKFRVLILEGDTRFQDIAAKHGCFPTQGKECDAMFPIDTGDLSYSLPEGFRITSMADTFDVYKYAQVLWKGFNHEVNGEGPFSFNENDRPLWDLTFKRPNANLNLKIAVVAPNGDFVSYCGMWHDAASQSALVEPVATDPAYRKMGLGRAAVLEGVRRCAELGAKRAFVGSSQQFYYSIGFRPFATSTWWAKK